MQIVGAVKDLKEGGLKRAPQPVMYVAAAQLHCGAAATTINSATTQANVTGIEWADAPDEALQQPSASSAQTAPGSDLDLLMS